MDLGIPLPEFIFFLILSFFFCLFVILPSDAMQLAGFTIPRIFGSLLGEEKFNFVEYHLRRTLLTIFVHATLPLVCFIGLELFVPQRVFSPSPHNLLQWMAYGSVFISAGTICALSLLYVNNWERHHLVGRLRRQNQANEAAGGWQEIAQQINIEMRQPMLFTMSNKDCSRTIVTGEWILKISNYGVDFARISDSQLLIVRSLPLRQAIPGTDEINNNAAPSNDHIMDLRVRSIGARFDPFHIRLRSQQELNNLRDQIGRPIDVLDSLVLPQPLHERFVDAFAKEVGRNPRYEYAQKEELEPCLGCSQVRAQVKLAKHCVDSIFQQGNGQSQENCRFCQCRPMWCIPCMGRIFASKQNQGTPEIWMAGRAPCPTCRATFCVLDVCQLDEENAQE